ncbi:MAG: UDP-N-acetylmuramate--L-alanine ligase [Anaerolineae bacterium]|nr:UDP-N-acetylmuramate--L-alanine ligase [Anaerolineae bacterium]
MTKTHFIGIGGTGLSAIARVLLERGQAVSGSDRELSPLAAAIRQAGAEVFIGHAAANVSGADVVVRSSAVPDDNVEVLAALQAGIPVLKRVNYLGQLLANHLTVAVAGTHGKTTTTSMIAWVLEALNQKPGFISGGVLANLGTNARAGSGQVFVIEADEYDHMFLGLDPSIAVVTNVEHDHPDFFPTPQHFTQAFRDFANRLLPDGVLLVCLDDPGAASLGQHAAADGKQVLTYGLSSSADYQARDIQSHPGRGFAFDAFHHDRHLARLSLQVPGQHNLLNALAALAVVDQLGQPAEDAALALADFRGADRRFQVLGEASAVTVVDDYAHHPTEIRATLDAARRRYPQRPLWVVWQPHTYSRTRQLLADYATAFTAAAAVVVTPVYAARESMPPDFSPQHILDAIQHEQVHLSADLDAAVDYLLSHLQPGDVLLTLSAGDAVKVSAKVYSELQKRN